MRITPLLCFQCGSWFQPKTKRPNKFCCNACRQANYRGVEPYKYSIVQSDGSTLPATLGAMNEEYKKDFIFKFGRDKFGQSGREWLSQ